MQHARMHKVTMYNGNKFFTVEVNARDAIQASQVARDMYNGIVMAVRRIPLKRREMTKQHNAHVWARRDFLRSYLGLPVK